MHLAIDRTSFNRTFMELKFGRTPNRAATCSGFNRTFMELKFKE